MYLQNVIINSMTGSALKNLKYPDERAGWDTEWATVFFFNFSLSLTILNSSRVEDRGSVVLQNFDILLHHYTTSRSRGPEFESWWRWESHISQPFI